MVLDEDREPIPLPALRTSRIPTPMNRLPKTLLAIALMVLLSQSMACTRGELEVHDPWIPAAPPNVTVLAGYLEIRNGTRETVRITGASSPDFERIEFHRTEQQDGMARMIESVFLEIPARSTLALEPGGHHLMLINARRPLDEGENAAVTLKLDDGREVDARFTVRRVEFRL